MLKREVFKNYLNKIKKSLDDMNAVFNTLDSAGINVREMPPWYTSLFDVAVLELARLMHDEHDTIMYYIFDLDWGASRIAENCIHGPAGETWSLRNPDELYDYLVYEYEKGKKE